MRIRWIYKGVVADVEERVHQVVKNQHYLEILLILNELPGDALIYCNHGILSAVNIIQQNLENHSSITIR